MSEVPELLERFRRGAEMVAVSITGAAGSELDYVPEPGKWSIRQIRRASCRRGDGGRDERLRRTHRRRSSASRGLRSERLGGQSGLHAGARPRQALETFRRIRGENYELLKDLPPRHSSGRAFIANAAPCP